MNLITVVIITIILSLSLYLLFFVLGLGGIARNRSAQGLEQKSNK